MTKQGKQPAEASDKTRGVYGKYIIEKADGSEVDPEACYFVLRLDTDKAARSAVQLYANMCGNVQLKQDIQKCLDELANPPQCNCAGRGNPFGPMCPVHDPIWKHVWEAGDPDSFPETQRVKVQALSIKLADARKGLPNYEQPEDKEAT